jgi:hypothetical protein
MELLFADPAYAKVAIMLALLVLTPLALWQTEEVRTQWRRRARAATRPRRRRES